MSNPSDLTALIEQEEDLYIASCPEIGLVSQGATVDEAFNNLKEATKLYFDELRDGDKQTRGSRIIARSFSVA